MISPQALLDHASALIRSGDEVDSRRAVSAGYYALFHTLSWSGAGFFVAAGQETVGQVVRVFQHATMVEVCRAYLRERAADPRLLLVAQSFIDLQEARHLADYDLAAELPALEAARLLGSCSAALRVWPEVAGGEQGRAFLTRLLLGPRLSRRG